ncbi:anoctamin-4-like isoform X2, partial [Brachionus plicatilis]
FEKYFDKNNIDQTIPTKDRCLLAYEILSRTTYSRRLEDPAIFSCNDNDRNIGIDRLIAQGIFEACYPLHEDYGFLDEKKTNRQLLWEYWARPKNWAIYQPIFIIRQYFGEKLAFYFAWLGFYTTWLVLPSIVGLFVFLYGAITLVWDRPTYAKIKTAADHFFDELFIFLNRKKIILINEICDPNRMGNLTMCPLCDQMMCQSWKLSESCFYSKISYIVDNPFTVFFSVFMAVWTVLFIEFWKREQSKLQFEWDVIDFEKKNEILRPEFELKVNTKRKNPITGEEEPYVPFLKRFTRYLFSFSMVVLMICLVVALVIGVIAYRVSLIMVFPRETDQTWISLMTSVSAACINLFLIIILSRFYSWLAVKLTDFEYHKTDSKYENSLTIKMYLFQFVNFYASIFYIAFFKGRFRESKIIEMCNQSGCLSELCIQLAIIMIGKQILNNIQEIIYPLAQNYWTRKISGYSKKNEKDKNRWIEDYDLMAWTNLTLFDEYLEMVIQYGFITLFVVAFPLAPLFAFLNNILEIRIDAFKVLTQLKRPLPKKAQDIGIWLPILNTISKLAVITNSLIIAFTSEFIPKIVYRFIEFIENEEVVNLEGYVNYTLSKNQIMIDGKMTICYYRDFREPYDSPDKFEFTKTYYYVLVARLAFLVLFEHVVFLIVTVMHWIPDVPKLVQDQIERENLITQKALWEIKPEAKSQSFYNLNRYNLNIPRLSESGQELPLSQTIDERKNQVDDSKEELNDDRK